MAHEKVYYCYFSDDTDRDLRFYRDLSNKDRNGNEVEEVCVMHAGVLEAAVIGIPDEKSGEAVKVYAIKKDPGLTAESLIAHCRQHLTGYKVPKLIEFRTELPKTNIGKILRRALRDS